MKITIELEGVKCSVEDENAVDLEQALDLAEQCLLGVGFFFKGQLNIIEEEKDEPEDD